MRTQRQNRSPSKSRVRYQRQETWSKKNKNTKDDHHKYEKHPSHWHPHSPEENKNPKK